MASDPAGGAIAAGRRALAEARSRTVWQAIADAAAIDPDRAALIAADDAGTVRRLTYGELVVRVRHLSSGLAGIGVERGDRVVLWMTNSLEWIVSAFAAMRIGAAVVPVNTFLKPPEIRYVIAQSGARHLVMLDRFRALDMPAILAGICPEFGEATEPGHLASPALPDLRNIVLFGRVGTRHPGAHDLAALEAIGASDTSLADRMAQRVRPEDLVMVKYTSGSTGFPKGVMLQQGGFVANGLLHSRRVGIGRDDIFFSMMPFFHAGGSIYGQMTMLPNGGTLIFTEAFDARLAVRLIAAEKPTVLFGVLAKEIVMEAHDQGLVFPSLRLAHVHNDAARRVLPNAGFCFTPFGLTETYGPCAITSPDDPPEKQMTTGGRLLDGNELRVVDPQTGRDVGPGEVGEAWVRGNVMLGYWNKPEETARAIDPEGWVHSEDLVTVDAEGFVTYAGRLKLMLKVGGENVSLEEVEGVVTGHEAVTHCAAVGVADERKGEAVRIYVIARADLAICEADLRGWLEPRLARFKMPREIAFVEALPRLANGKLDRVTLLQWSKQEIAA